MTLYIAAYVIMTWACLISGMGQDVWQAISNKTNMYILAVNTYVFLTKLVHISINWYVFNQHVCISKYVRIRFKLVPICSESARI